MSDQNVIKPTDELNYLKSEVLLNGDQVVLDLVHFATSRLEINNSLCPISAAMEMKR